ncbi:MAG TPA: arsenic transporter [Caulobacteraceae bacterium]|nr:arsenic transporter [Caulobacteraceae bacterium]
MTEGAKVAVWTIALVSAAGMLVRPRRTSEALWAGGGALALVMFGLVSPARALAAAGGAVDVCLFLGGMMLLAEVARREGLFDALAAFAVNRARGSRWRLLLLVYGAGVVVTTFLCNDATAVVLTPAVFAAARRAKADPLPHLFACVFVANAASFVLPISNPANLVLFDGRMPPLGRWLESFALPSALAIPATFAALAWAERGGLAGACEREVPQPRLTREGRLALAGVAAAVVVMLAASALDQPLGPPTATMGLLSLALVLVPRRASPMPALRAIAWPVLLLVVALFILVEGLAGTGAIDALGSALQRSQAAAPAATSWSAAGLVAIGANLVNNLPAGLVAGVAIARAHATRPLVDAVLIGVDLGPNLSITGSLATILWLAAIRREGEHVGFWRFLKVGAFVMTPALVLALAARLLLPL